MNDAKRRAIFARLRAANPAPRTELNYQSPFELLMAVILSEELEKLPGVGRKTANVILNTAFGEATIAVDTHIFRVANRTGLAPGKTVRIVEEKLLKSVPPEYLQDAHHWLILHGRYVCKARNPACPTCRMEDLCEYRHKSHAPV